MWIKDVEEFRRVLKILGELGVLVVVYSTDLIWTRPYYFDLSYLYAICTFYDCCETVIILWELEV